MNIPSFLKPGSTVGITAPSAPVDPQESAFQKSLAVLRSCGWQLCLSEDVYGQGLRSASAADRAEQLNAQLRNPQCDAVFCASGGDFLFEILPLVDWAALQKNPKILLGASDPTSLLFACTTRYDLLTFYGFNAGSFHAGRANRSVRHALDLLQGRSVVQKSYSRIDARPPFSEDPWRSRPSRWHASQERFHISGLCIGGCVDVLKDMIGTPYEDMKGFLRRHADAGTIWYLDSFSLSAEGLYRTLLQMRYAGWFDRCRGVILGRPAFASSETGMRYDEALRLAFADQPEVKLLWNADVGHTLPHFLMINGACLDLDWQQGQSSLEFRLK